MCTVRGGAPFDVGRGTNVAAISAGGSFECSHLMSLRRELPVSLFFFFGTNWSGKAPAFDGMFFVIAALTLVGRVTPGVCSMICPESFTVFVIFQSSNLTPTLFPSVHSSEPDVGMRSCGSPEISVSWNTCKVLHVVESEQCVARLVFLFS